MRKIAGSVVHERWISKVGDFNWMTQGCPSIESEDRRTDDTVARGPNEG